MHYGICPSNGAEKSRSRDDVNGVLKFDQSVECQGGEVTGGPVIFKSNRVWPAAVGGQVLLERIHIVAHHPHTEVSGEGNARYRISLFENLDKGGLETAPQGEEGGSNGSDGRGGRRCRNRDQ